MSTKMIATVFLVFAVTVNCSPDKKTTVFSLQNVGELKKLTRDLELKERDRLSIISKVEEKEKLNSNVIASAFIQHIKSYDDLFSSFREALEKLATSLELNEKKKIKKNFEQIHAKFADISGFKLPTLYIGIPRNLKQEDLLIKLKEKYIESAEKVYDIILLLFPQDNTPDNREWIRNYRDKFPTPEKVPTDSS